MNEATTSSPTNVATLADANIPFLTEEEKGLGYLLDSETGDKYFQRDGYRVVKKEFTGAFKGIYYHIPQFQSLETVKIVYGEPLTLDLINDAIVSLLRVKAKSNVSLPENKEKHAAAIAKQINEEPNVFTVENAEQWKPGTREKTAQGWIREATNLQKLASEAPIEQRMELFNRANEAFQKAMDMMKKEQELAMLEAQL